MAVRWELVRPPVVLTTPLAPDTVPLTADWLTCRLPTDAWTVPSVPETEAELCAVVAEARQLRIVGGGDYRPAKPTRAVSADTNCERYAAVP